MSAQDPPESDSAASNSELPNLTEFEQVIATVEESLAALKTRYAQLKADQLQYVQLKQQQQNLQALTSSEKPLKTELREIQQQIEDVEMNLESRLVSWQIFIEPFWLAVRFGGLGILIGWFLKANF